MNVNTKPSSTFKLEAVHAQDALRPGDQDCRRLRPDVSLGRDGVAALP
jgi:hypothetical protein